MAEGVAVILQAAVIARLKSSVGLVALVGQRVYDQPPQAVVLPYVRIGNLDVAADRIGCHVDDAIMFSIEVHSRPEKGGRIEALRIAAAVREALDNAPLALTGHSLDWLDFVTQTLSRAGDGKTYLAVLAFEAATAPAA